jgi:stearoyl-CoA desaturase (delta-9 desaturase)
MSRFQELVWINKYHYLFPILVLVLVFVIGEYTTILGKNVTGISAVVWGYFLSTFLAFQVPFLVNAFTHGTKPWIFSYRTYDTADTTTNNWLLCIFTMGASWHNNHHRYMGAARAGFFWWELDLTYWILKALEGCGIVWDLRPVPKEVLNEGREALKSTRRRDGVIPP